MVPLYNQGTLRCSDIQDAGIESILKCNSYVVEEKTFCDFLSTNKRPYNALMGSDEMIRLMSLGDYRSV